jgi:fructose-1-phosphate kinase PfkB-like protein
MCAPVVSFPDPCNNAILSCQPHSRILANTGSETKSFGSGDIFAAAFFVLHQELVDPFEAGHLATAIASKSVSALGLESVPNTSDILKMRDNIQR